MFRIGQKVVCIHPILRGRVNWGAVGAKFPRVGEVYTIRGISDEASCVLEEIVNPEVPCMASSGQMVRSEVHFKLFRFRPVTERKTDISALKELLDPANHDRQIVMEEMLRRFQDAIRERV